MTSKEILKVVGKIVDLVEAATIDERKIILAIAGELLQNDEKNVVWKMELNDGVLTATPDAVDETI